MYIATIPNRTSPPAYLLRESYREGDKVKSRTLANITHWPMAKIELLRRVLKDEALVSPDEAFEIERSLPHGHVAAVVGMAGRLGLKRLLGVTPCVERDRALAMILARLIEPGSKLATARGFDPATATTSLGETLGVAGADADDLYAAMDWLLARQPAIEKTLAKRHLSEGTLVLYDVTSSYYEGRKCALAQRGYNRDGKKGKLQIVYGLLCNAEGCPVAVEAFEGNTGDPKTVTVQIEKIRRRFELKHVVVVGDRGMLTEARIREEFKGIDGLDWITALRAPAIRKLVESGAFSPAPLFDQRDLAEITSPHYPGERLVVCRNPLLAVERARKREELLRATEKELNKIVAATQRSQRPLRGQKKIALRVGKHLNQFKVGKHFHLEITDTTFRYERNPERIAEEAALDGIYIVRTSVPRASLGPEQTVRAYKRLSVVERAFRSLKTVDLKVRPIYHRDDDRVRAHLLLCMLAYYVEWHMRQALAPILFDDDDKESAQARRTSEVAPAQRSERAQRKAQTQRTDDGEPVHSFQTLLKDLGTVAKNRIRFLGAEGATTEMITNPTPLQTHAFELLKVTLTP
jgi:transposase